MLAKVAKRFKMAAIRVDRSSASGDPFVDVLQLDAEHRRLNRVETAVVARADIRVARAIEAVCAQTAKSIGERSVVRHDRAAVAPTAERFAWKKTEAARRTKCAG